MNGYSQSWLILKVTTHKRINCSKHDLETIYSLSDLLDFVEDIEVLEGFQESADIKAQVEADNKRKQQEALKRHG